MRHLRGASPAGAPLAVSLQRRRAHLQNLRGEGLQVPVLHRTDHENMRLPRRGPNGGAAAEGAAAKAAEGAAAKAAAQTSHHTAGAHESGRHAGIPRQVGEQRAV